MRAITSAPSAICGTHLGDTNEAASTLGKPAAARRLTSSTLMSVGTNSFSFCRPSRGDTSTIFTREGKAMSLPGSVLGDAARKAAALAPILAPSRGTPLARGGGMRPYFRRW
ncbi:hypothetical protein G6F22_019502 [Rhizopus arrhizus]|nr:hypothetical protein G6F22_019502 [Rhizopus arrhizus]